MVSQLGSKWWKGNPNVRIPQYLYTWFVNGSLNPRRGHERFQTQFQTEDIVRFLLRWSVPSSHTPQIRKISTSKKPCGNPRGNPKFFTARHGSAAFMLFRVDLGKKIYCCLRSSIYCGTFPLPILEPRAHEWSCRENGSYWIKLVWIFGHKIC